MDIDGRQIGNGIVKRLSSGKITPGEIESRNNIMRITMIGASGAGKTWYMASMFHKFVYNVEISLMSLERLNNPTGNSEINEKIVNAIKLTRHLEASWNLVIEDKRVGTEDLTDLQLHMLYRHIPVFDISFIDYAGGALVFDKEGNEEQTINIQKAIWESDALLVILDTEEIFKNDLNTIRTKLGLNTIRQIFLSLFINNKMSEFIATPFILTKVDKLRKSMKTDKDKERFIQKCMDLVEPLASPFIEAGIPTGYFPVSAIGLDAYKPESKSSFENVEPLWVENPLLFCADKWMEREKFKLNKDIKNLDGRKRSPLHGITPAYFTEKKQREIEEKRTEITTKIQLYNNLQDTIHRDYDDVEIGVFNSLAGIYQLQECIDEIS